MYDLHTHSLLSDGALLPSEVCVRYAAKGYKVIAITDHVDYSNIETVAEAIVKFTRCWPKDAAIKVLPGVELSHLPPEQFKPLVHYARKKGIKIIIGHGETTVEPVIKGTNRAAIEAGIDILAHPGLITEADAQLARQRRVFLEVTARAGHCNTNAHVVEAALKAGADLTLDTDSHTPDDIITPEELKNFARSSGLSDDKLTDIYIKIENFLKTKGV